MTRMETEGNGDLYIDQQCKLREIKKNVGNLSGEIVKIMTKKALDCA